MFRHPDGQIRARTWALQAVIEDIAELIFPDAPSAHAPDAAEHAMLVEYFGEVQDFSRQRCWCSTDQTQSVYTGWAHAVRSIQAHLPAAGVLGFS